jgi:hypothetical protein
MRDLDTTAHALAHPAAARAARRATADATRGDTHEIARERGESCVCLRTVASVWPHAQSSGQISCNLKTVYAELHCNYTVCNYSHCVISGGGDLGDTSMHQAGSMIVSRPAASNRKQTSHSVHFIAESVAVQYRGNMLSQGGTVLPPPRPPRPRTLRAASTSAITCDISSHGRVCHHPRQQPRPSHAWLEFSLAGLRVSK